ncbi:MAG: hypothetical protein KatS3mg016_2361 [Fimbriimonadales bacterium]|nr:MAG: hypothetical protein KatS3mg016_2361 [Fimbriimonadales bacterium]
MKHFWILMAFVLSAGLASSQVFEPIIIRTPDNERVSTVSLFGSSFEWGDLGTEAKTGFLLTFQVPTGPTNEFQLGGWVSNDTQTLGSESATVYWYNLHFTWLTNRTLRNNFGISVGILGAQVEDYGSALWTTADIVSSFALDAGARWTFGATLGYALGSSATGDFEGATPASGFTYGLSLAYRLNRSTSIGVGFWTIDLTGDGGGRISRINGGLSFHF